MEKNIAGMDIFQFRHLSHLMIINNLNLISIALTPDKTYPVLVIDTYAMLA